MRKTSRRLVGCLVGATLLLAAAQLLGAADSAAAPGGARSHTTCAARAESGAWSTARRVSARSGAEAKPDGRCDTPRPDATVSGRGDTPAAGRAADAPSGDLGAAGRDTPRHDQNPTGQDTDAPRRAGDSPEQLEPRAPEAVDGTCVDGAAAAPSVTIPSDDGVVYRLDGERVAAGSYQVAPGRHHVHAVRHGATPGRAVFALTARAARCTGTAPTALTEAPSVQLGECGSSPTGGVQVLPPVSTGVDYRVGRVRQSSSRVTVRVIATAQAGHRLSPGAGWRALDTTHAVYRVEVSTPAACHAPVVHTRSTAVGSDRSASVGKLLSAPAPVVPTPPAFRDDTCVTATGQRSGASYIIPSTRGVLYWVNGADIAAGTYPARDGSTVTVVTSAAAGYSLSGISQWTHTFADAPSCSGVGSADRGAPPATGTTRSDPTQSQHPADATTHTPAYTGAPTGKLLTGALMLLLLGFVCCLAGTRRRPDAIVAGSAAGSTGTADTDGWSRSAATVRGILAARLRDVSLSDPAAGSGRTPPRPAPAVGLLERWNGRTVLWRVGLTAPDP